MATKAQAAQNPESSSWFWTPIPIISASIALRVILLVYGLLQDAYAPVRYTDIDYYVFTDAARYVSQGYSPYHRETYRYTPLLAWILLPTTWPGTFWFSFGKVLFSVADIVAGWLLVEVLRGPGGNMPTSRALKFASVWLLNPMVATISTRGSSEGFLGVMVVALLWAAIRKQSTMAGILLGLGVHFKIYPFIYAPSLLLYFAFPDGRSILSTHPATIIQRLLSRHCIQLTLFALTTFLSLNATMYYIYGQDFLEHTFFYHVTRIDHRHNFSPYNTLLYLSAAEPSSTSSFKLESIAFIPQLGLAAVLIPFVLTRSDLAGTMLAQTWAFVSLNKVCTSQYFLWYMALLPLYMPYSSLLEKPRLGLIALVLWVGAQGAWLQQGFQLEFNGISTFVPGLWLSGLGFYAVNAWILGVIIGDVGARV